MGVHCIQEKFLRLFFSFCIMNSWKISSYSCFRERKKNKCIVALSGLCQDSQIPGCFRVICRCTYFKTGESTSLLGKSRPSKGFSSDLCHCMLQFWLHLFKNSQLICTVFTGVSLKLFKTVFKFYAFLAVCLS